MCLWKITFMSTRIGRWSQLINQLTPVWSQIINQVYDSWVDIGIISTCCAPAFHLAVHCMIPIAGAASLGVFLGPPSQRLLAFAGLSAKLDQHFTPILTKIIRLYHANHTYLAASLVISMIDEFYGLIASLHFPWLARRFCGFYFPLFFPWNQGNRRSTMENQRKTKEIKRN